MPEVSLEQAASLYLASLKNASRQESQTEILRFVRWYGTDRPIIDLRGHDVFLYADVLGAANAETNRRAEQVRAFLTFLKKKGLTHVNLAPHLRLRKAATPDTRGMLIPTNTELTLQGLATLQAEMESLVAQRPNIAEELRQAMLDKDFRENAPLDAAKEKQAHLEARIREIERKLKHAVIVEGQGAESKTVKLGSTVQLRDLSRGTSVRYTIVGSGEANAATGNISNTSPVGQALLERQEGEDVEVNVPAGLLRFRIEQVEG